MMKGIVFFTMPFFYGGLKCTPLIRFKIGADSEKEQPSAEQEELNLIYSQKQKISRSITVRLMFNL
jgi:hypothetical protein